MKRIYFMGSDVGLVKEGLRSLLGDVENMIVTCPDPEEHEIALQAYENKAARIRKVLVRIDVKAAK